MVAVCAACSSDAVSSDDMQPVSCNGKTGTIVFPNDAALYSDGGDPCYAFCIANMPSDFMGSGISACQSNDGSESCDYVAECNL